MKDVTYCNRLKRHVRTKLRELRQVSGSTKVAISRELGCSPQSYGKYESGVLDVNLNLVVLAARYYGISVDELLGIGSIGASSMEVKKGDTITIKFSVS